MRNKVGIVWFRRDLRLADNPALNAALEACEYIVPLFTWSPGEEEPWSPGEASAYYLHQSLLSLDRSLRLKGANLVIRCGSTADVLRKLTEEAGAEAIFCNRLYEPQLIKRDQAIQDGLTSRGITFTTFHGNLLCEPWDVLKADGSAYQVFTAFARTHQSNYKMSAVLSAPDRISVAKNIASESLESLNLEPSINWTSGIAESWQPGELGAQAQLERFGQKHLSTYNMTRDMPGAPGVSRMSPYLHWGEISVRQVWNAVTDFEDALTDKQWESAATYKNELIWRDFSHHLLYHFPQMPGRPLKSKFEKYPWAADDDKLLAWQRGLTGYPIVDAGMRQLWQTGWMHNRVRMIVGSFLVKDLGISWQVGQDWFWNTLVDADLAQNSMNWQWIAGCGADAAPFFRIFNPTLQGRKFDPEGEYVKRFVPELKDLPSEYIHDPAKAPGKILERCGVEPGITYPFPIVDHGVAREQALMQYKKL